MSTLNSQKTKRLLFLNFYLFLNLKSFLLASAVLLCGLQHGVHRGAGRLREHLGPAAGALRELLRPVQERHAAQPGGAVPLLRLLQQLRPAGAAKVPTLVSSDKLNKRSA